MAASLSLTDNPATTLSLIDTGTALAVADIDCSALTVADNSNATLTLGDLP